MFVNLPDELLPTNLIIVYGLYEMTKKEKIKFITKFPVTIIKIKTYN